MRLTAPTPVTAELDPSAAEQGRRRTIAGMLVPYGPVGHTSAGPLTVRAGAIRLPEDLSRVKLLREERGHDRVVPIGHLVSAEDRADGLYGVFQVGSTPDADAAVVEASERLRDAFSVELHDVQTAEGGAVTAADLTAAVLVATPAFADARVVDVAASRTPEPPAGDTGAPAGATEPGAGVSDAPLTDDAPAPEPDDPDDAGDGTNDDPQEEPTMPTSTAATAAGVTASAPAGVPAGQTGGSVSTVQSMADVYATMAALHTSRATPEVSAALSDITMSANVATQPPQYVGELWDGVAYQRRIVPLLASGRLTSNKVTGWRWSVAPEVDDWAGDKAEVPSNAATTEAVETTAQRLAGAHDIDRAMRDFGNTEYFAAYYRAMAESYAKKSDARAAEAIAAAAQASTVPSGSGLVDQIVAGALAMPEDVTPTFILIARDLLGEAFGLTRDTVPALLAMTLGLDGTGAVDGVRIASHSAVPSGTVIVGARQAMTFYELPGSPIRVGAVDLVNGGVDEGVFGYYATIANHAAALQAVTVAAAG